MAERLIAIEESKAGFAKPKAAKTGTYFMACEKAGAVKIGLATDVKRRLFTLQAGNPHPLQILIYIPLNIERALHRKFNHLRLHREWFRLTDEILTFVDECKTGALLSEII